MVPERKPVRIYTDGGYRESTGSWAWFDPVSKKHDSGIDEQTTNQRMELMAACEAIDTFLDEPNLTIVSDSAYLVNTMSNRWYERWQKNGWVNSKGEAVANQDLWERLIAFLKENPDVRFEKVKGHSGDPGNEAADRLATEALMEFFAAREAAHSSRTIEENPFNRLPAVPYKLKPHQEEPLKKMHNGCVLNGDVGSGKTFTALAYFVLMVCGGALDRSVPMKSPKKLVIITTAKKRDDLDWESEGIHLGLFVDPAISYSGKEFIVDSWNNLKKYQDEEDAFFIFDEQRLVGNGAWVKAFLKLAPHNQWIMLSATPADNWIDYLPLFLAHGFFKNKTEFMDNHVVWKMVNGRYPKIKGYYGVGKLKRLRDQILIDMPYDRHTVRHLVAIEVEHDVDTFNKVWKARWNVFDDAPLLDSGEMHRVGRKVVNTDTDRLLKIQELGNKHDRMIIFYNFDYELEMLRTLHTSMDIKVAEWNGHKHEPVPNDDRWLYLVQYQAGAEGWNCTTTDCVVFYSLTYSHKIFHQSQGRIDRLDTPFVDLWYYILMSQAKIDKLIWRSLINKKNFHEGRKVRFNPQQEAA
jgi:ribonuclease HI